LSHRCLQEESGQKQPGDCFHGSTRMLRRDEDVAGKKYQKKSSKTRWNCADYILRGQLSGNFFHWGESYMRRRNKDGRDRKGPTHGVR
jgi:hypothetical protein